MAGSSMGDTMLPDLRLSQVQINADLSSPRVSRTLGLPQEPRLP